MFLCIPLVCGAAPHTKPEPGNHPPRHCPRCNNQSVHPFKRRTWFEFFWIPLIPFKNKHLLICTICQWTALNPDSDPSNPAATGAKQSQQPHHDQNFVPQPGRGYDVGYHGQSAGAKA
ncbi:hypothetical protein JCM10207_004412 [Rhodosporidiobolus poonsookiae]